MQYMNFKVKSYLQMFFSAIPKGEYINFSFQKYITKSLPIPENELSIKLETFKMHFDN